MQRSTIAGLAAALFSVSSIVLAQDSQAPTVRPAPPALMGLFDVSAATLQSLAMPVGNPSQTTIAVVLGGKPVHIDVALEDVRAPNFQLIENGPTGPQVLPTPPCVTYRGMLLEDIRSNVAATITGGSITAFIRTGGNDVWIVQPVNQMQPAAAPALHIVYRTQDNAQLPGQCGVNAQALPAPAAVGNDLLYLADIAIEADYPFFQQNGSNTTSTQNDITGIVNAMNVIWERDVDVRHVVSQIVVNSSPDAYTTTSASTLLNQFASRWNSVHAGIPRDFAHLFTGRNINGGTIGIAALGVVCNIGSAYGLSQSRYTGNYSLRVSLTAHEIGHNFGAGHCNAANPCYIMCSSNGGCGPVTLFSPSAINQIVAYRNSVSCLAVQQTTPVIQSVSAVTQKTVAPTLTTLTGSGFTGTTQVQIGSTVMTNGFTIISDSQLRFVPPQGLALGVHTMTVTNAIGVSNNSALFYIAANPAEVLVPTAVLGGTTLTWTMGGWNGDFAFLVLSLTNATSPWMGWNLVNGPIVFWTGALDARGMASYSFPVPANVLNGITVYSQLIDIVGGTLNVRSLSGVKSTYVVF